MGMPIIMPGDTTLDQAVTDLIISVAMQETSLSHILNAEGEKMEAIISMEGTSPEDLMRMNLQSKLELFVRCPSVTSSSMNGTGGES